MLCPSPHHAGPHPGDLRYVNSGGPRSRTRTQQVQNTLLGRSDGPIRCPRHLCLALDFGRKDPVLTAQRLLKVLRIADPELLRSTFAPEPGPMVCQASPDLHPLVVSTAEPMEVLRQALLLGLCTAVGFDPGRPVLWTQASLTRRLELFDVSEFYA